MGNEKKELNLESFKITGDIIKWNGSVIKIGNISYITNDKFELPDFPKMAVGLILLGMVLGYFNKAACLCSVAIGILWILLWVQERKNLKDKTILTLAMNAGTKIPILFHDKNFLNKVLNVLEEVMKAENIGEQNITVSIKNCDIHGNAKILTDMGIN